MGAVPTIVETLDAAKIAALDILSTELADRLATNVFSADDWAALHAAKAAGDSAIHAVTDPTGVTAAQESALAAMNGVSAFATALGTPVAWYQVRGIAPQGTDDWDAVDHNDFDGDSKLNWQEYVAGTDPTDSQSLLKMVTIRVEVGEPVYLEWMGGTAGLSAPYVIESTQSLTPQDWQPIGTRVRVDGINDWTGGPVLTESARFYRVTAPRDMP